MIYDLTAYQCPMNLVMAKQTIHNNNDKSPSFLLSSEQGAENIKNFLVFKGFKASYKMIEKHFIVDGKIAKVDRLSIYIHYPFCEQKCPYCDFNSHVNKSEVEKSVLWLEAYKKEMDFYFNNILLGKKYKIESIFFGGGTPSLMSTELVSGIIDYISKYHDVDSLDCEITLETNPSSFEALKFKDFKAAGVSRVSIGLQALNDKDLKTLGRVHDLKQALNAVKTAGEIFDNYSIDLIYARHEQDLASWQAELEYALKHLVKDHISLYALTIEKGTEYYSLAKRGLIVTPSEDKAFEFYKLTDEIIKANGFDKYEVSNYCKNDKFSRHNMTYWQCGDWIGIGAGAFSRYTIDAKRHSANNYHEPLKWFNSVMQNGNALQIKESVDAKDIAYEMLMMGLRLKDGIDIKAFNEKFDLNLEEYLNKSKLNAMINEGLVIYNQGLQIKTTEQGLYVLNSIINSICYC